MPSRTRKVKSPPPSKERRRTRQTRKLTRQTCDARAARSSGRQSAVPFPRPHVKIVEWSPEDRCFVGSAPPLIGRCCHGEREEEVFAQLSQIVSEWLAIEAAGSGLLPASMATKQFSGKFQLRLGADLHRLLAFRAASCRKSINDFAVEAIERAVVPGA